MRLTTGQKLKEVMITVELDESGDVAVLANGTPLLWVMSNERGIRLNECDEAELAGMGFKTDRHKVVLV